MSTSGEQSVPVVLKMANFSKMMKGKEGWESNSFYSYNKECKMCLSVFGANNSDGKNPYLSIQLSLVYNDADLPLKGSIKLLNQIDDHEHHCVAMDSSNITVAKSEWMIFSEWKNASFMPLNQLYGVSNSCNFIKNDTLFFEVYVRMHVSESTQPSYPFYPDSKEDGDSTPDLTDTSSKVSFTCHCAGLRKLSYRTNTIRL